MSTLPGFESPLKFDETGEPDEFKVGKHLAEANVGVEATVVKLSDQTMVGKFKWGQLKKMYGFQYFDLDGFHESLTPDDRLKLHKLDEA